MKAASKLVFAWLCLLGASAMMLVGCEPTDSPDAREPPEAREAPDRSPQQRGQGMPELCTENCDIAITLPEAVDQLPSVPDVIRVAGNTEVNFQLGRGSSEDQRTVLSFEQPAFVDGQGNPLYTLELGPGNNRHLTQPAEANVCSPPDGCRYVVIDVGQPQRPSIISSPYIIIE